MLLKFISFICGASVMILELAGMRIISPFLGSGFIVWTCTIGIIMASLSIGYYIGGKLSDKNSSQLKLSLFITLASLYILIIAIVGFNFLKYISSGTFHNLYLISIIVSIVIFTIPSILLGMVSPYIIKIAIKNSNSDDSGTIIGKFYAVSTIGSIFGTFLTGFFLIIFFGIDTILFSLSSILALSSLLLIFNKKRKINLFLISVQLLIIIISFFLIYSYKLNNKQIFKDSIYSASTQYQYIWIKKINIPEKNQNILCLTSYKNWCHSIKVENDKNNESIFNYLILFYKFYELKNNKNNILMLGGSGNTLSTKILKNSDNNITFDVVEIDKGTKEAAKKYFNLPDDRRLNIYYEDARTFINRESRLTKKAYDIIYFDIFKDNLIPFNILTKECFSNIKKLMANDSILCINIAINKRNGLGNEYLNQIYTQIKSVFPDVVCYSEYKIENNYNFYNIVITAYNNPNSANSKEIKQIMKSNEYGNVNITNKIFTDKYAPIEKFEIYKFD